MADLNNNSPPSARGPFFYLGAAGLIAVMLVETVAVIGRHIGWPLVGALEIIHAAILLAACVAMVTATLNRAHATVHLLTDRLTHPLKRWLVCVVDLLAAIFFAALSVGSAWIARDFWQAHEESEVLHISYKPLRLIVVLTIATIAALFLHRAWRTMRDRP